MSVQASNPSTTGGLRWLASLLCPFVVLLGSPGAPAAQQLPYEVGQWAGPYELVVTPPSPTLEISHALLLPPAGPTYLQFDRVLLQAIEGGGCFQNCGALNTNNQVYGRTYRWTARAPSNVTMVPPGSYPQDGSQTFFCGGHTFLANGHLLWVGGTDKKEPCVVCQNPAGPWGHAAAWRLDTSKWMPEWHAASSVSNQMAYRRWYPTATLVGNDGWVHGHTANPGDGQDQWRDVVSQPTTTPTWSSSGNSTWTASCDSPALVPLADYPRLHLLSTGELFWSAAFAKTQVGPVTLFSQTPSRFLDVKAQQWSCPSKRWRAGPTTNDLRINGSSVHLITWDPQAQEFTEVVYLIGGCEIALNGDPLLCPLANGKVLASVEKIVNPTGGSAAVWEDVPSLTYSRVNHNAVILLDGSILVVGGMSVVSGQCVYRHYPERYRPIEVFPGVDPQAGWQLLTVPHIVPRQYHSTAVLLPDGRVISVGGENIPQPLLPADPYYDLWNVPDHSLEIYSPAYFFLDPRPEIDAATLFDVPWTHPSEQAFPYDLPRTFEVSSTTPIRRVALIRNGAATHAFDSDQRYVELRIDTDLEIEPGKRQLTVLMPKDIYQAPPGYYLLTVLDENNMPSPAEWIRLPAP